ncbi:MAG: hypothetical protein HW378_2164, partial [Anaerolineales bacterium]|nr:hypothetical protein [Anaerolineales bacterium]
MYPLIAYQLVSQSGGEVCAFPLQCRYRAFKSVLPVGQYLPLKLASEVQIKQAFQLPLM